MPGKRPWQRCCCGRWPRHVELLGQSEGICGRGSLRHAQRVQRAARRGHGTIGGGTARRGAVCVQQPAAYADKNSVLGRDRIMGADQAAGARDFFLAKELGTGNDQVEVDPAGTGDVNRWSGFARCEVAAVA